MTAGTAHQRSLLELLLPGGRAVRALSLGSGCPARLKPAAADPGDRPLDLAVIAPAKGEGGRAWIRDAIAECAERLGPDGMIYVLAPRRARRGAARLLKAHGLALEPAILHLPDVSATRHLVPLEPVAAAEAFSRVVPLVPWKREAAGALFRLRAGAALAAAASDVALVARRPGARPLLAWLELPGVDAADWRGAIISSSWRPGGTSAVLHPSTAKGTAPVVAKLALDPTAPPSPEEDRLSRLGAAARRAGASVPEVLASFDLHGVRVLVETRVGGELAAPRISRRPTRLEGVLGSVSSWLDRWQAATIRRAPLEAAQLDRELLAPAEMLAPSLSHGERYLATLRERCDRLAGAVVPLTASHNDLTMWNVLIDADGRPGVLDWEMAEEATLPMKDFFYMAADAVAATGGYRDRPGAARACFGEAGSRADVVGGLEARLAGTLDLDSELVAICSHACWLGHALNEHRAAKLGDGRPFLEIVDWLAVTRPP